MVDATENIKEGQVPSVLIVEDDDVIRETLKTALELEGYGVAAAANGKEGLDVLSKIAQPCLILLDLMMPIMNGWQFAEALQTDTNLAKIPIVVFSAYEVKDRPIKVRNILKKPVSIPTLLGTVKEFCGEGLA